MKKYLLLLAVLAFILAGCGGESLVNKSLNVSNKTFEEKNESVNQTEEETSKKETGDSGEKESKSVSQKLEELKAEQKQVYKERSEVLKRMREVLGIMNSENISFEDRQFYEKAYGILKERKSSLTLEATLLENRIRYLGKKAKSEETLSEVRARLEELKVEEEKYKNRLKEVGRDIIRTREKWMESYNESLQRELKSLESEENEVLSDLESVREEIKDKEETVEELEVTEPKPGYEDLMRERQAVQEEISVVRNKLIQKYTRLDAANLTRKEQLKDEIKGLEDREDKLQGELRKLNEELEDY